MKRQLLLLSLLSLSLFQLKAEELVNALVVLTKDGTEHQFIISDDKPQISFVGSDLVVTCEQSSASASFPLADVVRFTYPQTSPSGVRELKDREPLISQDGGILILSNVKGGEEVRVYSADGQLFRQLKADHAGTYRISLSTLPAGVYIVKTRALTYKITKL